VKKNSRENSAKPQPDIRISVGYRRLFSCVTELSIKPRGCVGGILNVNEQRVKLRKIGKCYTAISRFFADCMSLEYNSTQLFASARKFSTLNCSNTVLQHGYSNYRPNGITVIPYTEL